MEVIYDEYDGSGADVMLSLIVNEREKYICTSTAQRHWFPILIEMRWKSSTPGIWPMDTPLEDTNTSIELEEGDDGDATLPPPIPAAQRPRSEAAVGVLMGLASEACGCGFALCLLLLLVRRSPFLEPRQES